jgi:hypothetical protein
MRRMLDLYERIRNFDVRKLTTTQIVVGAAAFIIAIFVIWQVVRIALLLFPIALGVLGLYLAYRWLSSKSEEIPAEMTKSKNQKIVEEAMANVQAASKAPDNKKIEAVAPTAEVIEEEAVNNLSFEAMDAEEDEDKLVVKQVINPETGFKEPDISRLIEREQEKLKEADRVNDEVMSQIEKRRQRLLGKDGQ